MKRIPRPVAVLAYLSLSMSTTPLHANKAVLTVPVNWHVGELERGLMRLSDSFLRSSTRHDVEYVGAVLQRADGRYTFTQGTGRKGQDSVTFKIRHTRDVQIVGFWHTHGDAGFARDIFSPTDADLVRSMQLPFYLITPHGEIRVLRPEHVTARPPHGFAERRLPAGSHPGERIAVPVHSRAS